MTTVVATRDCMASDSAVCGSPMFKTKKIYRINGSLIGISGDLAHGLVFLEWFKTKDYTNLPPKGCQLDLNVLELCADGLFYWDEHLMRTPILDEYYSVGSGSPVALGALSCGASVRQAIKIAAKYDNYTNSSVRVVKLNTGKAHARTSRSTNVRKRRQATTTLVGK